MRAMLVCVFLCVGVLGGCHSPRGALMPSSHGSITYESTELGPKTVTLVDTRTEEALHVFEIPPGRQLTLQFFADEGDDPVHTPDLMMWQELDLGTSVGKLRNSMTVPNAVCRRLDVDIRSGPESAPKPPSEQYRVDELNERPAWWRSDTGGGPVPDPDSKNIYDN
jgi:hypothetical protein